MRRAIRKEELMAQVQALAQELGRTPTKEEFAQDYRTVSVDTAIKHFGTWNTLLEAVGLKVNRKVGLSNDELIAQVQVLAQELGRAPTHKEFNQDSRTVSLGTAIRRFGSWNEFLKSAGLKVNKKLGVPDNELIAQMQMLAQELGRTPTQAEFSRDPRTASALTAKNHFGTWDKFLEVAELDVVRKGNKKV